MILELFWNCSNSVLYFLQQNITQKTKDRTTRELHYKPGMTSGAPGANLCFLTLKIRLHENKAA